MANEANVTVHTFVRHCRESGVSAGKRRPPWFDRALFLDALSRTAGEHPVTVFYDEGLAPGGEERLAGIAARAPRVRVERGRHGSEAASFSALLRRVADDASLPDSDVVYLAEDDYLHLPGWPEALVDALCPGPAGGNAAGGGAYAHYASLYDHPDKYDPAVYSPLTALAARASGHWRTAPSTTNTYACLLGTLRRDLDTHLAHSAPPRQVSSDHEKFLALWGAQRALVTRVPALATHAEAGMLSPGVDWAAAARAADDARLDALV